jgi:hypothetical protein
MTRTTIIVILAIATILSCQTDKKDSADNGVVDTTVATGKADSELIAFLSRVPKADMDFHFNTIVDKFDTTQLVFLPDKVIDKMNPESEYNYEFGHEQEIKSIRQFRDAYSKSDQVKIGFYRLLPITSNTYDILTAFVLDSKNGHGYQRLEWQVLTFDKNGVQISAIDRLHELYAGKDTLMGLWWYASNEEPHYETWIKNKDGKFDMTLQSEEIPRQLKGLETNSKKDITDNALAFINSYVENTNKMGQAVETRKWVNSNDLSTSGFKTELNKILDEAYRKEPEVGLDFDPILDAQDNPNIFGLESFDETTNYLVVKGKDWPEFKVTMKIKEENGRWLVDGCGFINIPNDKRPSQ